MERPFFPPTIDSTLLSAFHSCPNKFFRQYVQHWKPRDGNVHLIAGGAFAAGMEAARRAFYEQGAQHDEAVEAGVAALLSHYGDFECPSDSAKSPARTAGALVFYFDNYPLGADGSTPIKLDNGKLGVELSFAVPLEIKHPTLGTPILYVGRCDMVAEFAGSVYIFDEKTTSSLGAAWSRQWELRCFDEETEVYTRYGWKPISTVANGDEVLQWEYNSGQLNFVGARDVHTTAYEGPMVAIDSNRLSQLVTPNHRIPLHQRRGGFKVVGADKLNLQDGCHAIPLNGRYTGEVLDSAVQRLIAAVQADGTFRVSRGKPGYGGQGHREVMPFPGIAFKFTKERKINRLYQLLVEAGISFSGNTENGEFYISGYEPAAQVVATLLSPEKLFRPGTEVLYNDAFLRELRYWDGNENQYYTKHRENADFVQTVAHLNGCMASVGSRERESGTHYVVCLSKISKVALKANRISSVSFAGRVYCLSVPSGFLLIRREGKVSVSGNSQFTGYCHAMRRQGLDVAGTVIRGVSILKTKYETQQAVTYRPEWQVERWYNQLHRDIEKMIQCWEMGYWDYNLDHSCTDYGGCPLSMICQSADPERWLASYFEPRVWDPLARKELSVAEWEAQWK